MQWVNLLHIYQPPFQKKEIIARVVEESYEKILLILESRPTVKISLNICASLTEQLVKYGYREIINRIKKLAEKGQIELLGSAKYHPILPLLPKLEVIRQIKLNEDLNQKYFGKAWKPRPKGFFLPELAYSKEAAKIIQRLGYEVVILDEIAYDGKLGRFLFEQGCQIKDLFLGENKGNLRVVFRNRNLSLLFFGKGLDSVGVDPVRGRSPNGDRTSLSRGSASNGVDKFFSALKKDKRSDKFLITAFDGENLGHHWKYLADCWANLCHESGVKTLTLSEYLKLLPAGSAKEVEPLASSWATQTNDLEKNIPYPLWQHPQNQLHQLQWRLTKILFKIMDASQKEINYKRARELFDRALASDQYWWASAKPWWNPGIIEKGTRNFVQIGQLLGKSVNPKTKSVIEKTAQSIFNELERRKKSSHYRKLREKMSEW